MTLILAILVKMNLSDAIARGENFLLTHLWDTARIPVYLSHIGHDSFLLNGEPDSTDFGTSFFLDMARFSESPEIIGVAGLSAENIYSHKLSGDVWNYYPNNPNFPSDMDVIGVISWELSRLGYPINNIDTILFYRDPGGSGGFLTWLRDGPNDVDAAVNANLLRWLLSQGYVDTALMNYLESQLGFPNTYYYWSTLSVDYMITRVYRDELFAPESLKEKVLARTLASWPWYPSFSIAMAANVLLNLDYYGFELQWAIDELLLTQEEDGGWPAFVFYTGPGLFGSREMTTVFALLALYRYKWVCVEELSGESKGTSRVYDMLGRQIKQPKPYRVNVRNGQVFMRIR